MPRTAAPVPPAVLTVAGRQSGLVAVRQCLELGMTRGQVARRVDRKEWDAVARGVLDTGTVLAESDSQAYDLRRRRAALLGPLLHPDGIAVGLSSLVLHGVQGAPVDVVPEVAFPKAAPRPGQGPVRVRRVLVPRPVDVCGLSCAPVDESLALAVPAVVRLDAIAMIDSALCQGLLDERGLDRARGLTTGRRGTRRSQACWQDFDARSESPAESWARTTCLDRGFPPDVLQLWMVGAGWRARVDMAWVLPDGGLLLVEIDGADVHSRLEALVGDRRRQNRIDSRNTVVRRYSGRDARRGVVADEVSSMLARAGWRSRPVPRSLVYDIERADFVLKPGV